jgi:transcriptional regulator GlxA family with amidase domain
MLVGVRLRPGVAFILSGIAAHAIVGRRIRLTEAQAFRELVSHESASLTPVQLIDLLQRFLLARLSGASVHDVVADALREIEREHGCLRVSEIAARCRVSPRHLNRLMRVWIGYGPKRLANVVRFQSTLMEIDQSPRRPAAALASETGYFDQAHLASNGVADFSKTRCDDIL